MGLSDTRRHGSSLEQLNSAVPDATVETLISTSQNQRVFCPGAPIRALRSVHKEP